MSVQLLDESLASLPYALHEQVMSYARSIEAAAPEIFRDARIRRSPEATDQLIFIAGMRKLYAIVDSNYWVLDNAGHLLARSELAQRIRVGRTDYSRGAQYHRTLERVRRELFDVLSESGMREHILSATYADIVRALANGR